MSEKKMYGINDLLVLFEKSLKPEDILTAKLMAQVSTSITKERLKLRMNQKDFAQHIHASQSLVSRWEHGDYNFSIRKIAEIASSLNLDVSVNFHVPYSYESQDSIEYQEPSTFSKVVRYKSKGFSNSRENHYISESHSVNIIPKIKEEYIHAAVY